MFLFAIILSAFSVFGAYVLLSSILEASTPMSFGNISTLPLAGGKKGTTTAGALTFVSLAWPLTAFAAYYAFANDVSNTGMPLIFLGAVTAGVALENYRSQLIVAGAKPKIEWKLVIAGILIFAAGILLRLV